MHLVESWEPPKTLAPNATNNTRWIHAYTNGASVELQVNGKTVGGGDVPVIPMVQGPGSYAEWVAVPFAAGVECVLLRVRLIACALLCTHAQCEPERASF